MKNTTSLFARAAVTSFLSISCLIKLCNYQESKLSAVTESFDLYYGEGEMYLFETKPGGDIW